MQNLMHAQIRVEHMEYLALVVEIGIPKNLIEECKELDQAGEWQESEERVIHGQRSLLAATTTLELAQKASFSLEMVLNGTLANRIGPTSMDAARMISSSLTHASVQSALEQGKRKPDSAFSQERYVKEHQAELEKLRTELMGTFDVVSD